MLYGPRPLETECSVESLKQKILEVKRQPWAQVKLYHKAHHMAIFMPNMAILGMKWHEHCMK